MTEEIRVGGTTPNKSKRRRIIEEEQISESRSSGGKTTDKMDDKILDLLAEIRWSRENHLNGVPIDYSRRAIWEEMAIVLNEGDPVYNVTGKQVFERAKHLRKGFRRRGSVLNDKVNAAFGPCGGCGFVPQFPDVYAGSEPEAVRGVSTSSNSQLSGSLGSDRTQSIISNSAQAIKRITELNNQDKITLLDAMHAAEWLENHHHTGGYFFLGFARGKTDYCDKRPDLPPMYYP